MEWTGARASYAPLARLGPDILERPPRIDTMLERMSRADHTRWFGETMIDQSIVAGIGNMWLAEALWESRSRHGCGCTTSRRRPAGGRSRRPPP